MKIRSTELSKHYWNNEGAYETEFKQLTDELMPATGRAQYLVGEVVRAANRLYYEYCNNGNMNAREVEYWGDEEDGEYDVKLNYFYGEFITLIGATLRESGDRIGAEIMTSIEDFIINDNPDRRVYFSDTNMHLYDSMIDHVAYYALKHRDEKKLIPYNYKG